MAAQDVPEHKLKLAEVLEMMIADGLASNACVFDTGSVDDFIGGDMDEIV